MEGTNYLYDTYVAHKMSELSKCGAQDMEADEKKWLNQFLLNSTFKVTLEAKQKAYLMNFVRRVEASFFTYHEARKSLIEYIGTENNIISPYFRSLLNFEVCVSQLYQSIEILCALTEIKAFEKGGNSKYERLHDIYIDSKHMDKMIEGGKLPTDAMCAIWITDDGLESSRSSISFDELTFLMREMASNAEQAATLQPSE